MGGGKDKDKHDESDKGLFSQIAGAAAGHYPGHHAPPGPYPPQGHPPQGYPPSGYPPQGYPPAGYPQHGHPSSSGHHSGSCAGQISCKSIGYSIFGVGYALFVYFA